MSPNKEQLIARLLARDQFVNDPVSLKPRLRNPDGPEAATKLTSLSEEVERLTEGLQQIKQWAEAYPIDIFPDADLDLVAKILLNAGHLNQMDRMHASWARHITEGIGKIARSALKGEE